MVFKVRMPKIDANIQEGAVGRWLVECGQPVRAGQALVEIITDKAAFELEAEQDSILRRQVAGEKSIVPVGYVIALTSDAPDEPLPDVAAENETTMSAYRQALLADEAPSGPGAEAGPARAADGRAVRATPLARRMAAVAGLSLHAIAAKVGGVVRREHVQAELESRGTEALQ